MKNFANSYKWVILFLVLGVLASCVSRVPQPEERTGETDETAIDPRGFDPLEFQQDRQVVPLTQPRAGAIVSSHTIATKSMSDSAGTTYPDHLYQDTPPIDSLNNQAFRVQLFTTKMYNEAREASRVAEEIFDQPVFVDYEVPYFKVRVGSFPERTAAESYLERAKAAGYSNAWVVLVNVMVKEAQPLYDGMESGDIDSVLKTIDFDMPDNDEL